MKCLSLIALVVLLLSWPAEARAGGPFDGEWNGSATANAGGCAPGTVTLSVRGREAVGQASFDAGIRNVNGTVIADGTFGGTLGFQQITGRFSGDRFTGTFRSFDCTWRLQLERTR